MELIRALRPPTQTRAPAQTLPPTQTPLPHPRVQPPHPQRLLLPVTEEASTEAVMVDAVDEDEEDEDAGPSRGAIIDFHSH